MNYATQHWKILKRVNISKDPGLRGISSKFLKDGAEVSVLPLRNIDNLSIKQSLLPEQCKIAEIPYLKKALRVTRKITSPSHCYLLCLR